MLASLLTTKLLVPPYHAALIPRPRLAARLAEGLTRPLTLVSAPPGAGKTTLVTEWLYGNAQGSPTLPLAWLALDEDDNDPTRFLTYLIAALETIWPGIGRTPLDVFNAPAHPTPKAVLIELINQLSRIEGDFALALDDYHVITSTAIHEAITYLLEHLPTRMHLILLTRADPPLPLARLRVRGALTEIRAIDLRFTPEEVSAFLDRAGLALSKTQIEALEARTEGWAAGLQLAALSLQGQSQVDAFIHSFTGNDAFLVDYLWDEVLNRLPEDIVTFLLQTAELNYLCAPLCDALTGRDDSQAMLERLTRANLFLIPLDTARRWYRYHQLFADLLRFRLKLTLPQALPSLHQRLAKWYTDIGLTSDAVRLALAGLDVSTIRNYMERTLGVAYDRDPSSVLQWLSAAPDALIKAQPLLSLTYAWALIPTFQFQAAEARVADAIAASSQQPAIVAEGLIIHAFIAENRYQQRQTIEYSQQALTRLAPEALGWRSLAALSLGMGYAMDGQTQAALPAFEDAATWGLAANQTNTALHALRNLGLNQARSGQLRAAAATYERALSLAASPSTGSFIVLTSLGELYYEWHDLGRAQALLRRAADLSQQWGNLRQLSECHLSLARIQLAYGDTVGATHHAAEAERLKQTHDMPWLSPYHDGLHLRLGDAATALRWATSPHCRVTVNDEPAAGLALQQLLFARALIAQSNFLDAAPFIAKLRAQAEQEQRIGHVIAALILEALAHWGLRNTTSALSCLGQALALAEPEGYVHMFTDQGRPMAELLAALAPTATPLRLYVDKLRNMLTAATPIFPQSSSTSQRDLLPPVVVEELSERELEILRLLVGGASNRTIASQLVLALGTVKTHIHNIYGKLGVDSRTQAIARAHALGILNPH